MSEQFENSIRKKLQDAEIPFDPHAWEKMKKRLDDSGRRPALLWWMLSGLLIFVAAGSFWWWTEQKQQPLAEQRIPVTDSTSSTIQTKEDNQDEIKSEPAPSAGSPLFAGSPSVPVSPGRIGKRATNVDNQETSTTGASSKRTQQVSVPVSVSSYSGSTSNIATSQSTEQVSTPGAGTAGLTPASTNTSSKRTQQLSTPVSANTPSSGTTQQLSTPSTPGSTQTQTTSASADKTSSRTPQAPTQPLPKPTNSISIPGGTPLDTSKRASASPGIPQQLSTPSDSTSPSPSPHPKEKKTRKGFEGGITIGPDLNIAASMKMGKIGLSAGILLRYHFNNRWGIQTGAVFSKKIYGATPKDYYFDYPTTYTKIDADCNVVDVPLNVSYTFLMQPRSNWSIIAGASSYFMLNEKYDYYYENGTKRSREYENQNQHYFSVLNVGVNWQKQTAGRLRWALQPYVKVPLGGVGQGKVKLYSAGMALQLTMGKK